MAKGRLEALITVPTGGWDCTIDDSGGGGAVTANVPAGEYYLNELIDELETQLNVAATTDTITVSGSLGEGGTGKTSITSSGNATLVWTSTDLRDLLGYTGNLTLVAATANTSTAQAKALWRPDCEYDAPNAIAPWAGWLETDGRSVESPGGRLFSLIGRSKRATWLRWHAVARTRASEANETTDNESFERFVRECIWGIDVTWATPGGPFRFFPDADATDWVEYGVNLSEFREFKPEHWADGWAGGPWRCGFPRLVVQDQSEDRNDLTPAALTSGSSTTDGTGFTTASVDPTDNAAIYIGILCSSSGTAAAPSSVIGNGITYTLEEEIHLTSGTSRHLSVWRGMAATPSAGTIAITFGTSHTGCCWAVVEVPGANTSGSNASGATPQSTTSTTTAGTTSTGTLSTLEHENNVHICFVGTNLAAVTPDADFAELADVTSATPTNGLEVEWARNQTICTATHASGESGVVSLEVKAG